MKKKVSFKKNILRFNFAFIILLSSFIGVYYLLNQNMSNKYNETIQMYDSVSVFYSSLTQANSSFKSYLYTENADDLNDYNKYIKEAAEVIKQLKETTSDAIGWRFDLLDNMLVNYQQSAQNTKNIMRNENQEYQMEYNNFLEEYQLILKTSNTYYKYITDEMKLQEVAIEEMDSTIFLISMIIISAGILWMLVFSLLTIRSITRPLYSTIDNVKLIRKGEYDLSAISNTSQEMEVLCLALEDMATSVQKNILNEKEQANLKHQLLTQENENLKKDELLAQSELKMLQNQINPHFLFNTLNMIYKTADFEQATNTSDMVKKTSELLRYALDKASRTSDLSSEIESLKNYIYIQKKRFNERIDFVLTYPDKFANIHVPGMLIQPLVENAVKHGLSELIEDGEVCIEIQELEKSILISVSDNGKGVDTDVLEQWILNDFKMSEDKSHLGLYNVIQRVKMFYGSTAEISFNSYLGCGFEVTIEIQIEGDEDV